MLWSSTTPHPQHPEGQPEDVLGLGQAPTSWLREQYEWREICSRIEPVEWTLTALQMEANLIEWEFLRVQVGFFSGKLQAPLQIYGGLEIVIDMRTGTKGQLLQTWLLVRGLGLLKTLTHFAENLNYISEVKPMNNRVY